MKKRINRIPALLALLLFPGISIFGQFTNYSILSKAEKQNSVQRNGDSGDVDDEDVTQVFISGSGGLRSAMMNSSNTNTPLNGSFGATFITKDLVQLSVGYTLNDLKTLSVKTPAAYGENLLVPDIGGQAFTLSSKKYFASISRLDDASMLANSGVEGTVVTAIANWQLADTIVHRAYSFSANLGFLWDPFGRLDFSSNSICLEIFAGLVIKGVAGPITRYPDQMKQYFSTKQTCFAGPQLDMRLVLNKQVVFFSLPVLFGKSYVEGLTGPQLILGATISADLIKL